LVVLCPIEGSLSSLHNEFVREKICSSAAYDPGIIRQNLTSNAVSFYVVCCFLKRIDFVLPVSDVTTSIIPLSYFMFSCIRFDVTLVIKKARFIYAEDWQGGLHFFTSFFDIFPAEKCTQEEPFHFCKCTKWLEKPL
jgi:hypothetical protein